MPKVYVRELVLLSSDGIIQILQNRIARVSCHQCLVICEETMGRQKKIVELTGDAITYNDCGLVASLKRTGSCRTRFKVLTQLIWMLSRTVPNE